MNHSATGSARGIALVQDDGRSQYYVARAFGVSRSRVQRAVKRFREFGAVEMFVGIQYSEERHCSRSVEVVDPMTPRKAAKSIIKKAKSTNETYWKLFDVGVPVPTSDRDDMKEREQMGLDCLGEVNIKREVIDRILKTQKFPRGNQKYMDFLACSYKKQGFQSQEGQILYDNINDFLSRYYRRNDLKIMDNCKSTTGNNHGERAFNAMECIISDLKRIDEINDNYLR
ncbi:unnamed protein product [Phaedon cochleariae]|uniref:Insertion element IS150 protein InsJ-like helix-turn-helix domain-containing protein n=1 Tax=Phaedon cochleariae TaxID=80249 RepID=A0A9N9X3L4_PHACE|nr:unnamed protein product [Phaedon cochleariae]